MSKAVLSSTSSNSNNSNGNNGNNNPPSTPTRQNDTNNNNNDSNNRRRSKRVLAHQDPIIAPGYGTQKDLIRLTQELNQGQSATSASGSSSALSLDTLTAVMRSRGRGLRSQKGSGTDGNDDSGNNNAAASTTNAWADFMMEQGMGSGSSTNNDSNKRKAETETTPSGRPKRGQKKVKEENSTNGSSSILASNDDGNHAAARDYSLPTEWTELLTIPNKKKKGSAKKASKTASTTTTTTAPTAGHLLQAGSLDAKITGRTKMANATITAVYHCPIPTRIIGASIQITRCFTSCNAVHSFCLDDQGQLYGWGRNESQQLGIVQDGAGDSDESTVPKNVYQPTLVTLPDSCDNTRVLSAAVGKSHSVLLLQDISGEDADSTTFLMSVGANKSGQCSVKNYQDVISNWKKCVVNNEDDNVEWVQISCGEDFTVALSSAGHMYSSGSSQYGQLGNGETGEYFVTANKLAFANCNMLERRTTFCYAPNEKLHTNNDKSAKVVPLPNAEDILIQQIACGKHHTIAVEAASSNARPRIFSFGCGDYGCLGHGVQQDEYYPRMIGVVNKLPLGRPEDVQKLTATAGAHCSLFLTPAGHVYYWGKHRSMGEATMRPQLVDVLANNQHVVTAMAAGGQTVICSTALAQTVAWGQGPHGELGLGKAKSSSKPTFLEKLNGIPVLDVAAGYGHTLFVVGPDDKSSDKEVKEIEKAIDGLPEVGDEELEELSG